MIRSWIGHDKRRLVNTTIVLLFAIGALGITFRRSSVLSAIPFVLWLIAAGLFVAQREKNPLFVFKMIILVISGWAIETLGVKGGILFGQYGYGDLFGARLIEIPLAMGAIWFSATLGMMQLTRYVFKIEGYWKTILVSAALMTIMDAMAQLPAFIVGFWSYGALSYPPWFHPLAYFGISVMCCAFGGDDFVHSENRIAKPLMATQLAFIPVFYVLLRLFY